VSQVFQTYWTVGSTNKLPSTWPASLKAAFNEQTPGDLVFNGSSTGFYLSVAPPTFAPQGFTLDGHAIVSRMYAGACAGLFVRQ
jgi:hypothetical protein